VLPWNLFFLLSHCGDRNLCLLVRIQHALVRRDFEKLPSCFGFHVEYVLYFIWTCVLNSNGFGHLFKNSDVAKVYDVGLVSKVKIDINVKCLRLHVDGLCILLASEIFGVSDLESQLVRELCLLYGVESHIDAFLF